jgi:hypothetical protein
MHMPTLPDDPLADDARAHRFRPAEAVLPAAGDAGWNEGADAREGGLLGLRGQHAWQGPIFLAVLLEVVCTGSGPVLRHYLQKHAPQMSAFAVASDRVFFAAILHAAVLGLAWARRGSPVQVDTSGQDEGEEEREQLIRQDEDYGEPPREARWQRGWQLSLYGVLRTVQDICQLVSVTFAPPSYIACVSLLYPFLTAFLVRLLGVERSPYPPLFFPAALVSSAALLLIVNGGAIEAQLCDWVSPSRGGASTPVGPELAFASTALGIALGFCNILSGALANAVVKATGEVPATTLMSCGLGVEATLLALVAAAHAIDPSIMPRAEEQCVWPSSACHDWVTFGLLIVAAWGNLYLYLMSAVYLARILGPTLYVSCSLVAPIGTAIWSGLLLRETFRSGVSWAGMAILIVTNGIYFRKQRGTVM